jgi:hypothetical protein
MYDVLSSRSTRMKGILIGLTALACSVVWIAIIAPLIANAFGAPCKIAFWRIDRQNQHLRRWQYFWFVGVFAWGIGMFLFTTSLDLLQLKILGDKAMERSVGFTLGHLGIWLLAGMFFGYWSGPKTD